MFNVFFSFQMWTNVPVTLAEMDGAWMESGTTGASASTDGQAPTVTNVCLFWSCHESVIYNILQIHN